MAVDAAPRDETTCGRFAAESQPSADNIWHEVSTRTSRRRGGPQGGKLAELQWQRKQEWRDEGAIERIERPTRLDKARELGYKAKQGRRRRPRERPQGRLAQAATQGRPPLEAAGCQPALAPQVDPAHLGGRASRKYRNLRVLNSYWVGEDGSQKWHEVILVDPNHPAIENDGDLGWIASDDHKGARVPRAHLRRHQGSRPARAARVRRRPARASPATTGRASKPAAVPTDFSSCISRVVATSMSSKRSPAVVSE